MYDRAAPHSSARQFALRLRGAAWPRIAEPTQRTVSRPAGLGRCAETGHVLLRAQAVADRFRVHVVLVQAPA